MASKDKGEYLISDITNLEEVQIKRSSCCCCFCCNCGKEDKEKSKTYYINKWRKYLSNENENISKPFLILTNLWAHKNVIKELENTRLNPNLINKHHIRNDLEFYIPQLCTFLIFGEYEAVEEFLAFLCKACYASFFFAHRIIWFLKSLQLQDNIAMNEKIEYILQLIQTIFKSEKEKDKIERLHVLSSRRYIDLINKYNLNFLYRDNEIIENELNQHQIAVYGIVKTSENLIISFCDSILAYAEEVELLRKTDNFNQEEKIKPFVWEFRLSPEEIFIKIYNKARVRESLNPESVLNSVAKIENTSNKNINSVDKPENDVNLNSFMSTLKFIDELCMICDGMKDVLPNDQMAFLRKEITEINKSLPANVYTPFLKDSLRNYLICHVPITELKIFRTKNRAPFMIVLEVIRTDEIISSLSKDNKTPKIEINLNNSEYIAPTESSKRIRSHSMLNSASDSNSVRIQINNNDLTFDYTKKRKDTNFAKTFVETDSRRNRSYTVDLFTECDVQISKPVTISNLESGNKKKPLRGQNKIIVEENEDLEESYVKEGVNEYVKRRLTAYPISSKRKLSDNSEVNDNKEKKVKFSNKLDEEPCDNLEEKIKFSNKNEIDNEYIKFKQRARNLTTCEYTGKENLLNFEERKTTSYNKSEIANVEKYKEECKEINYDNTLQENKYGDIFGESMEEQSERIRASSPFGDFKSWKTFKMIIKSGEDLRQEQFATQLINEFHQIFMLEKVKCWVNPYEIIATGNNVGIIECVPNAISVDQLKRKIGVTSIRSFYETYFGPRKSKNFEKAIHNFIKSLAGYSLVCYFLQIKDRHNANILIDNKGHIIHIDFGFLLSNAPGKGIKFEDVPFKLTSEFVEIMGGVNSKYFTMFRKLLWKGFIAITKHSEKILILVEMMYCGHGKHLPCFENKEYTIDALKSRFSPRPKMNKVDYMQHVDSLIEQSIDNWRTRWYDKFQYYFQGIFY